MKNKKPKIALNMSAAAARTRIHLSEIKRAKRGGSDAFLRSGRINLDRLKKWFTENPPAAPFDATHPIASVDLGSLAKSLQGCIEVEERNLALLREAQSRGDAVAVESLTAAYGRSHRDRLKAEEIVRSERIARGELMTVEQHRVALNRLWIPMITLMRKLPRTLAPKISPGDDATAEKMITSEIEEVIAEMHRSLQGEPDPKWHLNLYFAAMLRDRSRSEILRHIDGVRKLAESFEPPI